MKPKDLAELLKRTIPHHLPILVTGAPGVGKSDIVAQACSATGADLILSHPAVSDPTDAKGLPWPIAGTNEATFLPFGELARALKATKLIFITTTDGLIYQGQLIRQMIAADLNALLAKPGFPPEMMSKARHAAAACTAGVQRVHVINGRVDEGLLA